jgi:hypothetical protein
MREENTKEMYATPLVKPKGFLHRRKYQQEQRYEGRS